MTGLSIEALGNWIAGHPVGALCAALLVLAMVLVYAARRAFPLPPPPNNLLDGDHS